MKKAELEKENLEMLEQIKGLQENIKALRMTNEVLIQKKMQEEVGNYLISLTFFDDDTAKERKFDCRLRNSEAEQIQLLLKMLNEESIYTAVEMYKKLDVYPENEGDEDG